VSTWQEKSAALENKMISVINQSLEERTKAIAELEAIDSTPGNLTKKQESRKATLLAKLAALRDGTSVAELRRWETDRLLEAAGLPRAPEPGRLGRLDEETEQEWRSFASGDPVRPTRVPKDTEVRANEAGTQSITSTQGSTGGYFVPQGIYNRALEVMRQYDAIFDPRFSNVVETATGSNMPFPAWDDASNASTQVSEASQSTEVDIANFGTAQLNAYSFRSKIVAVSLELLQDSNFPWPAILERVFAMRHARGVGKAFVNGTGVASPTGLTTAVIASGASPVIASGSSANTGGSESGATSLGTADIATLYHKLDPAYRNGAAWYMADSTLAYLDEIVTKMGEPLVNLRTDGDSGTAYILQRPVAICPNLPALGAGANTVFFGHPQYFITRRVPSSMYVRRFWENPTLVQYGLVGFESWLRADSGLVAPNMSYLPYQFIQNHS
jgi:HK97 family phage major capsid protein